MSAMFTGELRFLSNFSPAVVALDGRYYVTVEHAYQAAKTLDLRERMPFQDPLMPPNVAKRAGQALTIRRDWEGVKLLVMRQLLAAKFGGYTALRDCLAGTGDLELVETNTWHDQYWGDCECSDHRYVAGENQLGRSLMALRSYLAGHV
jgi:ribA/ribD-fused uncharacterized protein